MELQGVANETANRMLVFLSEADIETVQFLRAEMADFDLSDPKKAAKRLHEIEAALNEIRSNAFKKMKDDFLITAGQVTDEMAIIAGKEIKEQYGRAIRTYTDPPEDLEIRRRMFNPELTEKQRNEILEFMNFKSGPDSADTIGGWFAAWKEKDLQRVMGMVKRATVEQMELGYMIRRLRGWTDRNGVRHHGVLEKSHESARRVARTLINGVANAGKMEIYRQNADVIDGVKWLSTLDSRLCPVCANLDGRIWKPDELDKVQHPPAHFNCRCAIVPYIDLGPEFEIERPAEVKNFELDAEERYNEKQKAKGSGKRWDDLTYEYRKQLRYKEMKTWSEANGDASPYRQVKSSDSFKEYFDTLPGKSQEEWLGRDRYQLYLLGDLKPDKLVDPSNGYVRNLDDLRRSIEDEKQNASGNQPPNSGNGSDWLDDFDPNDYPERSEKNWDEPLAKAFIESLSEDERKAIQDWTAGYRDINMSIRKGNIAHWQQNKIDRLSKIIDKHVVPANARMYRVVGKDFLPAMMKRGVYFIEGAEISMEEFTATSMSKKAIRKTAKDFERHGLSKPVEFEFYVPAGSKAIPLSQAPPYDKTTGEPKFGFQKEWLFQKGITIRILEKKEFQDGRARIKALIIDALLRK